MYIESCKCFIDSSLIESANYCEHGDILITTRSNVHENIGKTTVYLGNEKPAVGQNIYVIKHKENGKFLSYILSSKFVREQIKTMASIGTVSQIKKSCIQKIKIPLPPKHVQDQIANYLDKWTSLESQLEQELEQRKKQYEYYKESLLNSGMNKWEIISLGKIATEIISGNEVIKAQLGSGNYPAIRYAEIFKHQICIEECTSKVNPEVIKSPKYCAFGDLLFSKFSENIQETGKTVVYLGSNKPLIGQHIIAVRHEENPKFLQYLMSCEFVKKQMQTLAISSTVFCLYSKHIKQIKIPLPSLEEQSRIVEILDKFHTITESFKDGLPSLIEKHRKQYTYYKEQILNPEISL